jgi:lysine-N-methylase
MEPTADATIPARPRLAEHVLARLHKVEEKNLVVLFDQRRGTSYQLGMREWVLLQMADGTRDRDGILLAAAREGSLASPDAIDEFLARLHREGMLAEGPLPAERGARSLPVPADRPIDPLADYRFTCDGRGVCCHQYSTIVFSQLEAARARVLLPLLERGGDRHEWVFTPRHGSVSAPACAVKHVDGACAYLDDGGLCRIHAAGGAHAKPFGCNLFPARFVDDGEAVRLSALVECACVVRSARSTEGSPLIDASIRVRGELPSEVFVEVLPPVLAITATDTCALAELVAWSRAVLSTPVEDPVAWLWTVADALDRDGALPSPGLAVAPVSPEALAPWLRAWRSVIDGIVAENAAWRSDRDVALHALDVMRETLGVISAADLLGPLLDAGASQPDAEAFHLRATAHAHQWITERPLSVQLRNLAMRLVLARALHRFQSADVLTGEAFSEPVALVEAMCRGYGAHVDDPA